MAFILALCFCLSVAAGCARQTPTAAAEKQAASVIINNSDNKNNAKILRSANTASAQSAANVRANSAKLKISEHAAYTDKEHVAAYINEFAKLPHNYITKKQARKLGWQTKGTLDKVAPGKSIGGDRYGNYENKLPKKNGRWWTECDIDYVKGNRNAKRIVFSNDGLIYYTGDHYNTFTKLY